MSESPPEPDAYASEPDTDGEGGEFPEAGAEVVEFGWQDERKLSGRRKKTAQVAKKKAKAGTFGELLV